MIDPLAQPDLSAQRDLLAQPDPVAAFWQAHRAGEDITLSTSGTTSATRTIVRSTDSWVASFGAFARRWGLDEDSRVWIPGPLRSTMNLFAAVLASHVGAAWQMARDGATHAALTPSQLRVLVDADPPSGLHVLVAGDALEPGLRHRAELLGVRVNHYYGAAELSIVAWGHDGDSLHLFDRVEAQVRDDVLWVRSPWLARLDLVDVESDEAGFATVGDLARLDGDRLTVLGRPGAVTTAGATVAVAPVEAALQQHSQGRVVVLGLPHQRLGAVLCCVAPADDLPSVRSWARANLSGARRPRRWVARDRLPTTAAGKLDRRALARELS